MAAPATIEKPLDISIRGSEGRSHGRTASGKLHVDEIATAPGPDGQGFVAIMAYSLNSPPVTEHEELAIQGMLSVVDSAADQHLSDLMKQGFREANRAVRSNVTTHGPSDADGVAMLALVTRGKYATLGLVGPDRAYLMRSNRLTQLTRDQRVLRARSRRKQDVEDLKSQPATGPVMPLLGEEDRLDSRSPAIFEITLLPEDRLGLLSSGVLDLFTEDRILAALGAGSNQGPETLTASTPTSEQAPLLAAVLQVAPSREAPIYVPAAAAPARPWWPALVLIVALFAIAAAVYFVAM
jgi:serine/threonine protein phosphatase PrpC